MARMNSLRFVVLLGVVSLFADVTYEGARSITGPYLALLGATGTIVGIVAGAGELIGYALRLASGYWVDRTHRYWTITIAGYFINLVAVPALALAGNWWVAAALIILERTGKAIRTPARDAMLSHATQDIGRGWAFGLHEALDQIGACLGPLIVALALYLHGSYENAFLLLGIPATLCICTLLIARSQYPDPRSLEQQRPSGQRSRFHHDYWFYLAGACCIAFGYADYPLIAYHFQKTEVVSPEWIAILYSVAMAVDGIAALCFGYLYDRIGLNVVMLGAVLSALFAPFVFFGGFWGVLFGTVLWGIGLASQESVLRAAVADMTPADRRGTAYGIFNAAFGIAWFAGSALLGILYDTSIDLVVFTSIAFQLASLPYIFISMATKPAA